MSAVPRDSILPNNLNSKEKRILQARTDSRVKNEQPGRPNNILAVLVLLSLIVMGIYGFVFLSQPDTLPIKHIELVGDFKQLSSSRLEAVINSRINSGFFAVDVAAIRKGLLQEAWVEEVVVNRSWPDSLRIFIKERVAVARWGEQGLLNIDAEYFQPTKASIPQDLPILIGPEGSYELLLYKYNELAGVLSQVDLQVVGLTLNQRRAWSFKLVQGITVVIGRGDYEHRVKRFVDVVIHAMANRLDEINEIDMRYTNGFAVRWKEKDLAQILEQ